MAFVHGLEKAKELILARMAENEEYMKDTEKLFMENKGYFDRNVDQVAIHSFALMVEQSKRYYSHWEENSSLRGVLIDIGNEIQKEMNVDADVDEEVV